jgi:hypothetical protein
MLLDPDLASIFIQGYAGLMAEIYVSDPEHEKRATLMEVVAAGRARYAADPKRLDAAVAAAAARGKPFEFEVTEAVRKMQLKKWIFLRDTKRHSLFLDPQGDAGYGVLGLTQRIRDIVGGSGAVLETALVPYRGRFVCDGVISEVLWLGPNYRKDFAALFSRLKKNGAFHVAYEP